MYGANRGIAYGQTADAPRRRHVAIEQGRRERQVAGDIVEAVPDLVGRQQRRFDLNAQQVAHGVRVLGAVEAMRGHAAGIGLRRRRAIQLPFKPGREPIDGLMVGTRPVDRRHDAATNLPHHLLPHRGIGADVVEVEGVEGQASGLETLVMTRDAVPA